MKEQVTVSGNLTAKKIELSGNTSKDVKKVTQLMVDQLKRTRSIWRKEINHWQHARRQRLSVERPRLFALDEVYDDIMLDGHLTAVTENRALRITNKDYIFSIDGVKNDELTDYIYLKQWFEDILNYAQESIYRGHSLIWLEEINQGEIKKVSLVDRGRVVPEQQLILKDYTAENGLTYTEYPNLLLYAQFYNPIGLLEKAAVYTILKRHSWGSWDEFEELFGVPIRIAKIASQSEQVKNEVAGFLEEMGSAAYGVFPLGTEVEIKENSKSDAFNVFYQKINALDKELSTLVQHQTMTTENGSSRSQGEVHERTYDAVIKSDEKKMLIFLNDQLVPAMRFWGYNIPENARITVEQTANPKAQIDIDSKLMNAGYVLKKEYIEGTYGVEIEQMPSEAKKQEPKGKH